MYLCSRMEEILDIKSMPTVQIIQALGKRFKEYRIAARMTQKEVAEQSGVSLLTIRRFEQGYSYDIKLGLARQDAHKPKRVRHGQQH